MNEKYTTITSCNVPSVWNRLAQWEVSQVWTFKNYHNIWCEHNDYYLVIGSDWTPDCWENKSNFLCVFVNRILGVLFQLIILCNAISWTSIATIDSITLACCQGMLLISFYTLLVIPLISFVAMGFLYRHIFIVILSLAVCTLWWRLCT